MNYLVFLEPTYSLKGHCDSSVIVADHKKVVDYKITLLGFDSNQSDQFRVRLSLPSPLSVPFWFLIKGGKKKPSMRISIH